MVFIHRPYLLHITSLAVVFFLPGNGLLCVFVCYFVCTLSLCSSDLVLWCFGMLRIFVFCYLC